MAVNDVPPPMVAVLWEDAAVAAEGGPWVENKPRPYKPHLVHQVGFLILDEPSGIQLVSAWNPDLTDPPDQIPRGMIRSITPLAPASTKRRRGK